MAESGVPHQLEGQLPGRVAEDAAVKFSDPKNQILYQFLKVRIGRLVLGFVGMVPFPVVVL